MMMLLTISYPKLWTLFFEIEGAIQYSISDDDVRMKEATVL
jgi:hypothetical protein